MTPERDPAVDIWEQAERAYRARRLPLYAECPDCHAPASDEYNCRPECPARH